MILDSQPPSKSRLAAEVKRKWLVWTCSLFIFAGTAILFIRSSTSGTLYQGKPVRYCVDRLCDDDLKKHLSVGEVKGIGSAAVPYLKAKLRVKDSQWRRQWDGFRDRLPPKLRNALPHFGSPEMARFYAIQHLEHHGPAAKAAAPDLAGLINDQLTNQTFSVLQALSAIGPDAKAALPSVRQECFSKDALLRVKAAKAVWMIGRETNLALMIFTHSLSSGKSAEVDSTHGLSLMGPAAVPAVPQLLSVLRDTNRDAVVRGNSAFALGQIGFAGPEVVSALLLAVKEHDPGLRGNSAIALWRLDDKYLQISVPIAFEFARDLAWDSFVKFAKANQLDLRRAAPFLQDLRQSEIPDIRRFTEEALRSIQDRTEPESTSGL